MGKLFTSVAILATLAFALTGCGDDDATAVGIGSGGEGTIDATLKDFDIQLDKTSVPSGAVTLIIQNEGPSTHEFVVVQTDAAAGDLPTADGDVDEDQVDSVDEAEDIEDGASTSITADLEPGHYVVFCNLPGHYTQGMSAEFTVT